MSTTDDIEDGEDEHGGEAAKAAETGKAPEIREIWAKVAGGRGGPGVDPGLLGELESVARASGCELVHAEWKGSTLRLFIDREGEEGGVTLGDCEHVSKQVSALLDVVDYGKGRYLLEVSSPGLDRQLYRPRDYARFVGRLVRVTFEVPGAKKRTVVGRLREFHAEPPPGSIEVALEGKGEVLSIALGDIRTTRLEIELG